MKIKTINLILALALCLPLASFARSPHVPVSVMQKLNSLYPNAKMITWKDNNGYEADFVVNNKIGVSMFNEKGELLYSRLTIAKADLPEAVVEELNWYTDKGFVISSTAQRWYKGRNFYEVEIKRDAEDYLLHYYKNGRRIAKINKTKQNKLSTKRTVVAKQLS